MRRFPHAIVAVATVAIACGSFGEDTDRATTPPVDGGSTSGVDGSASDAGNTPVVATCPADAAFCDSFDAANLDAWGIDRLSGGGGNVEVTSSNGEHFFRASHPAAPKDTNAAFIGRAIGLPLPLPSTMALRARVRLPGGTSTAPTGAHVIQIRAVATDTPLLYQSVFEQSALVANSDAWWLETKLAEQEYKEAMDPSPKPETGRWVCVEIDTRLDTTAAGESRLYVDGALVQSQPGPTVPPAYADKINLVIARVGLLTPDAVPSDVFYDVDDVAAYLTSAPLPNRPILDCPR